MDLAEQRLGDARPAQGRAVQPAALQSAFEEAGVRRVLPGEIKVHEVDGDVVAAGLEPLAVEGSEVGQ